MNSIYLHDTRSRRKTLELPDSPWHPNSSPKADHRKPCRALMSRIFRWGPDSHWEPQSLWRRQIPCFLSVFPCLFHLHTEFETPSKGSLNPMSTHHFSSCRSVESTHYMYDSTMNQMTMLVFDHCLRILAVLCCFNHGAWCLNPQAGSFFLGEQPFYTSKYLLKCPLHSIDASNLDFAG